MVERAEEDVGRLQLNSCSCGSLQERLLGQFLHLVGVVKPEGPFSYHGVAKWNRYLKSKAEQRRESPLSMNRDV